MNVNPRDFVQVTTVDVDEEEEEESFVVVVVDEESPGADMECTEGVTEGEEVMVELNGEPVLGQIQYVSSRTSSVWIPRGQPWNISCRKSGSGTTSQLWMHSRLQQKMRKASLLSHE